MASSSRRRNEKAYLSLLAKTGKVSAGAPLPKPRRAKASACKELEEPSLAQTLGVGQEGPKKRQGVKEKPIMTAIRDSIPVVEFSPERVSIAFPGARLFSLNELLAICQYRKYILFGYKKLWRDKTRQALLDAAKAAGRPLPRFPDAVSLSLFRQGKKKIDRDSLEPMFKFIIDALKDEPKEGWQGLFSDDNPDVVQDTPKFQSVGAPLVMLRIEACLTPPKHEGLEDFFERPERVLKAMEASLALNPASAPKPPAKKPSPEKTAPKKRRKAKS